MKISRATNILSYYAVSGISLDLKGQHGVFKMYEYFYRGLAEDLLDKVYADSAGSSRLWCSFEKRIGQEKFLTEVNTEFTSDILGYDPEFERSGRHAEVGIDGFRLIGRDVDRIHHAQRHLMRLHH